MCVVSMVGDHYNDKWKDRHFPSTWTWPGSGAGSQGYPPLNTVSKQEFDSLKAEVLEMKQLLLRAIEYDKRNSEPNCEMEEKVALLKQVAKMVGVSLEDVFPQN